MNDQQGKSRKTGKKGSVSANKCTTSTDATEKQVRKANCNACNEVFTDGEKMVNCEACDLWNCKDCAGLTMSGYKILQNNKHMHFFCDECNEEAMSVVKTKFKVFIENTCKHYTKVLSENLTDRIAKMEKEVEQVKLALENPPKDTRAPTLTDGKHQNQNIKDMAVIGVKELEDRNFRKQNIIIYNLDESTSNEKEEKKDHDLNLLKEIMHEIGANCEVKEMFRLGAAVSGRVRPLKVMLNNGDDRDMLLKNARKLMKSEKYNKTYINRDLTPLEQETRRALVTKMKEKQAAAEAEGRQERWFIRQKDMKLIQGRMNA